MSENLSHRRPVCVLRHRAESEGSRRYSWTTTSRSDIFRVGRLLNAAFDAVSRFRALPSAASSTHAALDARARHMARTPRSSRPRASSTTSLADPTSLGCGVFSHDGRAPRVTHSPARRACSRPSAPNRRTSGSSAAFSTRAGAAWSARSGEGAPSRADLPRGERPSSSLSSRPRRASPPRDAQPRAPCVFATPINQGHTIKVPVSEVLPRTMLRVLLAVLLSFASLASVSASTWTEVKPTGSTQKYRYIESSSDGTMLIVTTYVSPYGGKSVWTSADSGETWTSREYAALPGVYGIAMSSDGTKLAATAKTGNIWTSTDSGANWAEVVVIPKDSPWQQWFDIASSSDGTKLAAALFNGHIWTSTDSGANWAEMKPTTSTQQWAGITMSSDGTKLAATVNIGNIWTSTDSGANWAEVIPSGSTQAWSSITMSSDGTKLAAVVSLGGNIWTSTNSGETWTSTASTQDWRGITMSSDGTKLYATVDHGNIWTFIEPFCYENSHVSNGACVPCGPNLYRAQGDPIDGGDTECECKCKARTRAWGFSMSD